MHEGKKGRVGAVEVCRCNTDGNSTFYGQVARNPRLKWEHLSNAK